jgi:hypothetical protein
MKDYLGHEIHIGDILLYNQKASKGYYSSFTEGIVVNIIGNGKIEVCDIDDLNRYKENQYYADRKYGRNTLNLTALDIRQNEIYRLTL